MKQIKKILVSTDFSELSLSGLQYVVSQPEFKGASIFLMHVIHDVILTPPYPNVDLHLETILRDSEDEAKQRLMKLVNEKFKENKNITLIIRRGEPGQEIIRFATEWNIDLIVIATHGRTGFAHVVMGSVAERVVRHSPAPVLTVKPQSVLATSLQPEKVEHPVER